MGTWAHGHMGIWAYVHIGTWAYGHMGIWPYGIAYVGFPTEIPLYRRANRDYCAQESPGIWLGGLLGALDDPIWPYAHMAICT